MFGRIVYARMDFISHYLSRNDWTDRFGAKNLSAYQNAPLSFQLGSFGHARLVKGRCYYYLGTYLPTVINVCMLHTTNLLFFLLILSPFSSFNGVCSSYVYLTKLTSNDLTWVDI